MPSARFAALIAKFATAFSLLLLTPAALHAQATAPALNLGSAAVGASTTGVVTFTFSGTVTVTSIYVLSQGSASGDFVRNTAAPGNCATSTTYTSGNTCTVGVKFTAGAPGTRVGAVTLATTAGPQAAGYAPVYGTGTGAQLALPPGVETAITNATTTNNAFEMAADQAGNVYYGDYTAGNLYKDVISGTTAAQTTIASGLGAVAGIAVDGAGDVFLALPSAKVVYEYAYLPASATYGSATLVRSCAAACWALAIDPAGDLFVGEAGNIARAVPGGGGSFLPFAILASGFTNIIGLAVDANDTLYIADQGAGKVYVATTTNGTSYTSTLIDSGHTNVNGMALDAAGDIYASDTALAGIQKYTPNGQGGYTKSLIGTIGSNGVAVTGGGVVYANNNSTQVYVIDQKQVNSTTSSSLYYTSPETPIVLFNSGNSTLALSSTVPGSALQIDSDGCVASPSNAAQPGKSCNLNYQFQPTSSTTPQSYTITIGTNGGTGTGNVTANVSGTATKVGFFTPPPPIVAGGNPGTVRAIIEDTNGYFVTTSGTSISLSSNYNTSTSYGSATTAANGGLATFNASTPALTVTGTYTYTATSGSLTSVTANETVVAGPATQLTATPASTTAYVGQAVSITVKALDQYGNQSTSTDTVSLTATPSTATLPANFALSSGSGTGSVTFTAAGTYTVTAQDVTNSGVTQGTTTTITVKALPIFVVGTLADDATGTASNCPDTANGGTANNTCTLRDAVAAANAVGLTGNTGLQPTITFDPSIYGSGATSTCTVSSIVPPGGSTAVTTTAPCIVLSASATPLNLSANVNIAGPGPAALAVSGNSAHVIFTAYTSPLKMTISGLTMTLGLTFNTGGAALQNILANSAITLSNDVFYKNTTGSGGGGAVYDNGTGNTLNITNSSFDANTDNAAASASNGGAIYLNLVTFTISGSTFTNNVATSTYTGSGSTASGGALYAATCPSSTVRNSSFIGNTASSGTYSAYGGAVYSLSNTGSDTYTDTVFIGNTAKGSASSGATAGSGGALYYSLRPLTLVDSLVQGNVATSGSTSTAGQGGGLYSTTAKYLYNTTVTGNYAKGSSGGTYSTLYTYNSIVYGNSAASYPDASTTNGTVGSLLYTASSPSLQNPVLSAPSNTGSFAGPMNGAGAYAAAQYTVIPLPGSPALRYGSTSTTVCSIFPSGFASGASCLAGQTTDARGNPRTQTVGGATYVDAGATEANYTAAFVAEPANALVGAAITGTTSTGTASASPSVQLYESNQPFAFPYFGTLPSALSVSAAAGTLAGPTTEPFSSITTPANSSATGSNLGSSAAAITYSSGLTAFPGLSITPAETNDTLTASYPINGAKTVFGTVTSNPFNVTSPIAYSTAPPANVLVNGAVPAIVVKETSSNGAAYVSGDTVTLVVTGPSSYSQTYTASSANGSFSFNVSPLPAAGAYTFTASDSAYTTQTAVATTTAGTQVLGSLTVTGFPAADHNGVAHNVTVTAYDTTGAVFTGFIGTVTLSSNDPLASFTPPSYAFTGSDAGVHTFSATLATGGTRTITATADAANGSIAGTETGIVVDDFIWVLNNTGATTKLDAAGTQQATTTTATTASTYGGMAFDSAGNAWSVTSGVNALNMTTKADVAPSTFSGTGGLNQPVAVAIDGAGLVWVANAGNNSVSEFTNAGVAKSGTSGYASTTLAAPSGVAIDNTGGVWVSNRSANTLVHIFGGATPVVTPQSKAVTNATVGVAP